MSLARGQRRDLAAFVPMPLPVGLHEVDALRRRANCRGPPAARHADRCWRDASRRRSLGHQVSFGARRRSSAICWPVPLPISSTSPVFAIEKARNRLPDRLAIAMKCRRIEAAVLRRRRVPCLPNSTVDLAMVARGLAFRRELGHEPAGPVKNDCDFAAECREYPRRFHCFSAIDRARSCHQREYPPISSVVRKHCTKGQ